MTRNTRILRYGISVGVALIGVICGATLPGTLGGTLATGLIGIGLVGVLSLIFYEVGLSEDRDRAAGGRRACRRTRRATAMRDGDGHGHVHGHASGDPSGHDPATV